jgi:hypothetical protein
VLCFDRYNITSTDDVKDAIKTVTRYNKRKAGKQTERLETMQVYCKQHKNRAAVSSITSVGSTSLGA